MSARVKPRDPHGLTAYFSPGELRVAIAALFRAGFSLLRIALLLGTTPAKVELELREYLLEARP